MSEKFVRDQETLENNNVLPGFAGFLPDDQRHKALVEVMCRIPEEDFEILVGERETFIWFIPDVAVTGAVQTFSLSHQKGEVLGAFSRVLYLSPGLENEKFEVIVKEVAHQLAHIVLEHESCPQTEGVTDEDQAFELVVEWGLS